MPSLQLYWRSLVVIFLSALVVAVSGAWDCSKGCPNIVEPVCASVRPGGPRHTLSHGCLAECQRLVDVTPGACGGSTSSSSSSTDSSTASVAFLASVAEPVALTTVDPSSSPAAAAAAKRAPLAAPCSSPPNPKDLSRFANEGLMFLGCTHTPDTATKAAAAASQAAEAVTLAKQAAAAQDQQRPVKKAALRPGQRLLITTTRVDAGNRIYGASAWVSSEQLMQLAGITTPASAGHPSRPPGLLPSTSRGEAGTPPPPSPPPPSPPVPFQPAVPGAVAGVAAVAVDVGAATVVADAAAAAAAQGAAGPAVAAATTDAVATAAAEGGAAAAVGATAAAGNPTADPVAAAAKEAAVAAADAPLVTGAGFSGDSSSSPQSDPFSGIVDSPAVDVATGNVAALTAGEAAAAGDPAAAAAPPLPEAAAAAAPTDVAAASNAGQVADIAAAAPSQVDVAAASSSGAVAPPASAPAEVAGTSSSGAVADTAAATAAATAPPAPAEVAAAGSSGEVAAAPAALSPPPAVPLPVPPNILSAARARGATDLSTVEVEVGAAEEGLSVSAPASTLSADLEAARRDNLARRRLSQAQGSARAGYTLVANTTDFPYSMIGRLYISDWMCTGSYISPVDVLTAAHCMVPGCYGDASGPACNRTALMASIFQPGKAGNYTPYGSNPIEWGDMIAAYTEDADTAAGAAYWDMAIFRVKTASKAWFSVEVPQAGSEGCIAKEPIISCGYPGFPNNGFQQCTSCTMSSTTNFCDSTQDVIHTRTPCYTAGGHSGGGLRFQSSPLVIRGTLSRGNSFRDLWAPFDAVTNSFFFDTSTPRTIWAHTYAFQPAGQPLKLGLKNFSSSRCTSFVMRALSSNNNRQPAPGLNTTAPAIPLSPVPAVSLCNASSPLVTFTKLSTTSLVLRAQLPGIGERCLQSSGFVASVAFAPCRNTTGTSELLLRRQWWFQDHAQRIRSFSNPGRCLQPGSLTTGILVLRACGDNTAQKWSY